jgi:WD40 repeat protein
MLEPGVPVVPPGVSVLRESIEVIDRDVFVVHADEDTPFVKGELLPMLGLPDDRVILSSELPFPAFVEQAIAASVRRSRLTLAVVSPAYLRDRWAGFAELLSRNVRDDGRGGSLVPLLLADCEVPDVLAQHAMLDCRTPPQRKASAARIRERLGRLEPPIEPVACPYPGMQPFTAAIASRFHGRVGEIKELVGRLLAGDRDIYVIGPSGSGKSSLIAAGLIPRLASESRCRFAVRKIRPGEHPMQRLAEALACDPDDVGGAVAQLLEREACERLLVFVDQLEELFALADADERQRFVRALGVLRADRRCHQIVAMRADFYGALMSSELWPDIEGRFTELKVAPLRGEALREAIVAPALQASVYLERELVERLTGDAAAEPGALPLLQEALVLLWNHRSHRLLRLASYEALGEGGRSGLAVALANRADAVLHGLSLPHQRLARRIFLRLVSFGEGRPDTRRQQSRAALAASGDEATDVDAVIDRLIDERMLTSDATAAGEPLVDLAHEALIAGWPAFQRWLLSRRDDEQRRRLLELRAAEWAKRGRGSVGLFDAVELAEAERWIAGETARELGYSDDLPQFLAASRVAIVEAERQEKLAREERLAAEAERIRLRWRLKRFATVALTLFSIIVSVLGFLALQQRQESERQRQKSEHQLGLNERAQARSLIVESNNRIAAISHLAEAVRLGFDNFDLDGLIADVNSGLWRINLTHGGLLHTAMFSPDGARVVTASSDYTARIWDATTGDPIGAPLEHKKEVWSAAFSPDSTLVVTASADGTARMWDATTGIPVGAPLKHKEEVWSAVFSPNGARIVTASGDGTARVWNTSTGAPIGVPLKHEKEVWSATFSPDSTLVVTASGDGTARVWNAATGTSVGVPLKDDQPVYSAAFSPDGTRVVTASGDGTARVWDVTASIPIGVPLRHEKAVHSAVFSLDGTRVVTASGDGTARIWDAATGTAIGAPLRHERAVWRAVFSPTGARVLTASLDGTARVWDAATGAPFSVPLLHNDAVHGATFAPDGARVVTASWDGRARIWDVTTNTASSATHEPERAVSKAISSPDGTRLVTTNWNDPARDATARIWDVATGTLTGVAITPKWKISSLAFSPDGTRIATASGIWAQVWDAATGKPMTSPLDTCPPHQDCKSPEWVVHHLVGMAYGIFPYHINLVKFSRDNSDILISAYSDVPRSDSDFKYLHSEEWAAEWDVATGAPIGAPIPITAEEKLITNPLKGRWEDPTDDDKPIADDETTSPARFSLGEIASLSDWVEQATLCVEPENEVVGSHVVCPISKREATLEEDLDRVRSMIAVGDATMSSLVWSLPRANYQRAITFLSSWPGYISGANQRKIQELQRTVSLRLAIVDAFGGDLAQARARLGPGAPATDVLLLDMLGEVAHGELKNNAVSLQLLLRAYDLDPKDVGTLANLAKVYFVTKNYDGLRRCLADFDKLQASPDLHVAVATLAWAAARLTRIPEVAYRSQLISTYHELANGARIDWTWKGVEYALKYGHFRFRDVKPIVDVLTFLKQPVTDVTRATFVDLLPPPIPSRG